MHDLMYYYHLKPFHILDEESVSIVPRQKDVFQYISDTVLFEAQIFSAHHRGVN
jgi:hypothetical protein